MKGVRDIRVRIQCTKDKDHAKILPIQSFLDLAPAGAASADREMKLYFARRIGEIICGNSSTYIYKPAGRSPIGRCVLCGAPLRFEVQDLEEKK